MSQLLDQLIDAMDAAEEHCVEDFDGKGNARRVQIVLAHGCLIAVATIADWRSERRISLDVLEASHWQGTAREIVEQAVNAL